MVAPVLKQTFTSIADIKRQLPTEQAAHRYLAGIRWQHGIVCTHCGSVRKIHAFKDGKRYKCADCRKQFTVTLGTIFQDSPLPLRKWITAIWLMTEHGEACSPVTLERELSVTYKTAWLMHQRMQLALGTVDEVTTLAYAVAADTAGIQHITVDDQHSRS